jgi:hypothetical protein
LLPSFFALTDERQRAAVLFHEGMVIVGVRNQTRLIAMESAMESLLKCSSDCGEYSDVLQLKVSEGFSKEVNVQLTMMLMQRAAEIDAKKGLLKGILSSNGDMNIAEFLGPELHNMLKADFGATKSTAFSQVAMDSRELRLLDLAAQWPESRLLKILSNTDLVLTFVRFHRYTKHIWNLRADGPALRDSKVTAISKWNADQLSVRFSQRTLSYQPEVWSYWLKEHAGDSDPRVKRSQDSDGFFSNEALFHVVQPVDIQLSTQVRKVYATLAEKPQEESGYYRTAGSYYYYLFGLTLM